MHKAELFHKNGEEGGWVLSCSVSSSPQHEFLRYPGATHRSPRNTVWNSFCSQKSQTHILPGASWVTEEWRWSAGGCAEKWGVLASAQGGSCPSVVDNHCQTSDQIRTCLAESQLVGRWLETAGGMVGSENTPCGQTARVPSGGKMSTHEGHNGEKSSPQAF